MALVASWSTYVLSGVGENETCVAERYGYLFLPMSVPNRFSIPLSLVLDSLLSVPILWPRTPETALYVLVLEVMFRFRKW